MARSKYCKRFKCYCCIHRKNKSRLQQCSFCLKYEAFLFLHFISQFPTLYSYVYEDAYRKCGNGLQTLTICFAASSAGKPREHFATLSLLKASQTPSEAMMSRPPALES